MFDYIIVGAGSAGCVLANRLSADPSIRVCLLESGGPDRHPFIHVPLGLAGIARIRSINWGYYTEPQPALGQRRLYWPRGRTLGGSSSINAMIYMRGHPEDYREWGRQAGPQWDWEAVRAIFLDHENNESLADDHHRRGGPLNVADLRHVNPLSRAFVEAGTQCQLPPNDDFNGAAQEGVGLYQVTQKDGQRFSSARAFLEPARSRPNLVIETGADVRDIRFENRQAIAIRLRGREIALKPGGEILLAAGAVNSPKLLMLSGIGPGEELARNGIATIHHSPQTGANLADHLDVGILARTNGRDAIGIGADALPRLFRSIAAYWRHRQGELTSNVAEAGAFARSGRDRDRPNLQFHFLPALMRDHGRKPSLGYGVTLHVCDLLPRSRGTIGLNGPDPASPPRIDANYLSHPDDIAVLVAGVRIARQILSAPALARHVASEWMPGEAVKTDDQIVDYIRASAETIYHPVGTCRVGNDADSVVDPAGRVRGVEGLRVADASIMPTLIAGNTNAPTMMIAENIARMILGGRRA